MLQDRGEEVLHPHDLGNWVPRLRTTPVFQHPSDGTVGGDMLASALKATRREAAVAICGLAASADLHTTVLPFILRGVTLYGIDSVPIPIQERQRIWQLIADEWKLDNLSTLVREVALEDLEPEITRILQGGQTGRVLVAVGR